MFYSFQDTVYFLRTTSFWLRTSKNIQPPLFNSRDSHDRAENTRETIDPRERTKEREKESRSKKRFLVTQLERRYDHAYNMNVIRA